MKRLLMRHQLPFLATMAASLLLACQHEADEAVVGYVPSTGAISFDAATGGAETRAVGEINDNAALQEKGFGVFACLTGKESYENATVSSDFMYNQLVTYTSSAWTYTPMKYWPNNADEQISFFAYAPHEAAPQDDGRCIIDMSKHTDLGDPWINYRLPAKPWGNYNATKDNNYDAATAEQIDLLYGVNSDTDKPWFDQKKANYDVSQKMTFTFHHALACTGDEITLQLADDLRALLNGYSTITINKVTIVYKNLTSKGRLILNSWGSPNWKEIVSGELTTSRTLVIEKVGSDALSTVCDFDLTITNAADGARTISTNHGLFYIPMQVSGTNVPVAEITLNYTITVTATSESVTGDTTGSFVLSLNNMEGKKQGIALMLGKNLNLLHLVYVIGGTATEPSYAPKR